MAGKPAAVVINTAEIIVPSVGNVKKESHDKNDFSRKKKAGERTYFYKNKLPGVMFI